jgi:hypothetical protein
MLVNHSGAAFTSIRIIEINSTPHRTPNLEIADTIPAKIAICSNPKSNMLSSPLLFTWSKLYHSLFIISFIIEFTIVPDSILTKFHFILHKTFQNNGQAMHQNKRVVDKITTKNTNILLLIMAPGRLALEFKGIFSRLKLKIPFLASRTLIL